MLVIRAGRHNLFIINTCVPPYLDQLKLLFILSIWPVKTRDIFLLKYNKHFWVKKRSFIAGAIKMLDLFILFLV